MRQIGRFSSDEVAQRFVDCLFAHGIDAQAEQDQADWVIWIREEDQLAEAREQLDAFRSDPEAEIFRTAAAEAASMRRAAQAREAKARKNLIEVRQRWNQPMLRRTPFVSLLIGLSLFTFVFTDFGASWRSTATGQAFLFQDPKVPYPWQSVQQGQVWRTVTPVFLHKGLLHLGFNMYLLYLLGGQIEMRQGVLRFALLTLFLAVGSNLLQAAMVQADFGGMSGVVYGLLGYLWIRQTMSPQSGYGVRPDMFWFLMAWMLLGFSGALAPVGVNVANWAHGGGFAAGVMAGAAAQWWNDTRATSSRQ